MGNNRQFFRIQFFEESVVIQDETGVYRGTVRDLSGGGISFYLEEPLAFDTCILQVELKKETYILHAKKVRVEKKAHDEYVYGCQFIDIDEKTQSSIVSELLRMDAIRRKK